MNLVDLIAGQLSSGDVLGKLGGLIGADDSQTKSATSAAVPALLNVFSKLASTNSGADQLAKAMGGLDLGMLGNLAGALGGSQASGLGSLGGNLLGSLLGGGGGGNNLSSLVGALASFAGMQPGIMKTLLTYLAPIVLGMVAKQFTGRPDAAGVSRLFSEQAANIRGGMPKGFSLPDLALGAVSGGGRPSEPARSHGHDHAEEKAGMPGWLLPLLVLGALGLGYYLWNQNQKKADEVVAVRKDVAKQGPVAVDRTEVIEKVGKNLVDTVTETIMIDPKFLEAGKVAGGLFTGLTKALGGVTDVASAKALLPEFEKFAPMLTTLEAEADKLPADEKPAFAKVIADNLGLLGKLVEKVMAIPGVRDVLGPVVTPMIDTLTTMSK
jgi:hypothetical protein